MLRRIPESLRFRIRLVVHFLFFPPSDSRNSADDHQEGHDRKSDYDHAPYTGRDDIEMIPRTERNDPVFKAAVALHPGVKIKNQRF